MSEEEKSIWSGMKDDTYIESRSWFDGVVSRLGQIEGQGCLVRPICHQGSDASRLHCSWPRPVSGYRGLLLGAPAVEETWLMGIEILADHATIDFDYCEPLFNKREDSTG